MKIRRLVWPLLGAVALVVFLAVGVFPTRTYFGQRQLISAETERVQILTAENSKLTAQVDKLHTDAEVERLAREQYNLVRPGEEAYAILPGPADPQPVARPSVVAPPPPAESWWDRAADLVTFWD